MNLMASKNPMTTVLHVDEMTARQERVAELRSFGWTLEKIAREIGVSVQTVHADLKRVREIWKDRQAASYEAHVADALARLDVAREVLKPKMDSGSIAAVEAWVRLEDRSARLLGIDKPVEQKVTISIEAVAARIAELEALDDELPILEGEVVEDVTDS